MTVKQLRDALVPLPDDALALIADAQGIAANIEDVDLDTQDPAKPVVFINTSEVIFAG